MNEIIDSIWYGIKLPVMGIRMIGIIAMRCKISGKMKFYIGLGRGEDEMEDANAVAKMGVPFYPMLLIEWILLVLGKGHKDADITDG